MVKCDNRLEREKMKRLFCVIWLCLILPYLCSCELADTSKSNFEHITPSSRPSSTAFNSTSSKPLSNNSSSKASSVADKSGSQNMNSKQNSQTESVYEPLPDVEYAYEYVWIPAGGTKYHASAECSGMKNPSKVLLSEAAASGYTPCKRCYK